MTTTTPAHPGDHTAVTCLACGALSRIGHLTECPAADPNATGIHTETLTDGTERIWTVVGARYTLTPARRQAIADCMPGMRWVRPIDRPNLSFHTGALVNEVVPQLGIANRLASIGVNELATVAVPDCGCADPWRCRCDFPDHPFRNADPDLWPEYGLLGLKVRYSNGWTHVWLLDTGTAAVVVATDFTAAPAVEHVTKACWLGWCDRCPGTVRPPTSGGDPTPCRCSCRHNPSAPGGGSAPTTSGESR
ncbi:MAG: hypothetical protein QOE61_2862 [Micromonosporaceae bacterium]|nr:hypothetical protein [Micromonosporaceae bacterium]